MTVSPLIAPESSIGSMIDRLYPEEVGEDETLSEYQLSYPEYTTSGFVHEPWQDG